MVSMDAITLDVSNVEGVQVGDTATLIGRDGDQVITAEEVAEWSGTISYEVLTSIGPRVERNYSPNTPSAQYSLSPVPPPNSSLSPVPPPNSSLSPKGRGPG